MSVVERAPSRVSTRTRTSVIVACKPKNSMRLPARPPGAVIIRRSTIESGSSRTLGSTTCSHHREAGEDRQAQASRNGRAPHDVVTVGRCLRQLEVCRARFMGARARLMREDGEPATASSRPNHRKARAAIFMAWTSCRAEA